MATKQVSVQDLVEQALAVATLPTTVIVRETTEANLRWAANELTTNGQMASRSLTVVSIAEVKGGTAVGTLSREVSEAAAVPGLVAAAEQLARSGGPAEDAMPLIEDYPHGDPWQDPPATTDITVFADLAPALGAAFQSAAELGHLLFGFAEHIVTTVYLGNSNGLRRRAVEPTGRFELNAKSPDFADSAWVGASTRDFSDVDVTALHSTVTTRLGWSANRIDLPAGRYEALLPPSAVADLMIYAYWTANARDAEEGRNVFAGPEGTSRIGDQLAALPITLSSDPMRPGLECVPFVVAESSDGSTTSAFDNGMPLAATDWIVEGKLVQLRRNRAWATKTNAPVAAPVDNLIMAADGNRSLQEMIGSTTRGLLLTCLWYIREVDPERLLLTGLTRDGVYLVENGEVTGAVNNFRFNESPVELLQRITEVGVAEQTLPREWSDFFTRTAMPPVRVPDFNMSTVSQAS